MSSNIHRHNVEAGTIWGSAGRDYDDISRAVADGIEHCVVRLAAKRGENVLDVATGTGWTSRGAARDGAKVIGIDIGEGVIAAAREIAAAANLDIAYRVADAESLPFDDGEFDAVISTYGCLYVNRPKAAAAEFARVCRKGGRLAMATWLPHGNLFEMFEIIKRYMPGPDLPPPPTAVDWGKTEWLNEVFGADFTLRFETGTSFHRAPDSEAMWQMFVTGWGPTKALVSELDEQDRAKFKDELNAFHDQFRTELGITVPRDYLITVGIRQ